MRRTLLAALALAVVAGACASGSEDGDRLDPDEVTFEEVRLDAGAVVADTGLFSLEVGTDPVHLRATLEGEDVVSEAPGTGLFVVRDGQVVGLEQASTTSTSSSGLAFSVTFADGSTGELSVSPVDEHAVRVGLQVDDASGVTHWGERLLLPVGEVVWGLEGPSPTPTIDRAGQVVQSPVPFHQTTSGYGLLADAGGPVAYDVGVSDPAVLELRAPLAVDGPGMGYTLVVGPTVAEVLEERSTLGALPQPAPPEVGPATAEQLQAELAALQQGSFTGVVAASAKAGGAPAAPDDEVLLRSLQLAALVPVMLTVPPVDSADPAHARWLDLHEALGPYLEEVARASADEGVPQVRPMALRYGDLRASWELWDQYLLGDDLLVAPVTEVGVRERRVWFPPGRWVSLWDPEQVVEGPLEVVVDAPLDQIPLYVRDGSDLLDLSMP